MRPSSLALLPLSLALAPLCAQQSLAVPPAADVVQVTGYTGPGAQSGPRLYQQVLAGSQFGAVPQRIESLSVALSPSTRALRVAWELRLGHAARSTRQVSETVAANRGADLRTLFSGELSVDRSGEGSWVRVPLASSFAFDPRKGDLLVELRELRVDPQAPVQLQVAEMPALLTSQRRGVGGAMTASSALLSMWSTALYLGEQGASLELDAYVNHMTPGNGSTLFLLGYAQSTAVDLQAFGAAGSTLYVDPLWVLPAARRFMRCGGQHDHLSLPVPAQAQLKGLGLSVSAVTQDQTANLMGLVFADAMDLEFGDLDLDHGRLLVRDQGQTRGLFAGEGYQSLVMKFGLGER